MLIFNTHSRIAMWRLAIFSTICIFSISLLYFFIAPYIERQNEHYLLSTFQTLLPDTPLKRKLLDSAKTRQLGEFSVIEHHAQTDGKTVAHFIQATTNKGYSGDITLLIAIAADNETLLGVRTLTHKETPGLGDNIELQKSNWIKNFTGKTLTNSIFKVKKDGGDFDAFTGATITPRAVTDLVGNILSAWQNEQANSDLEK